MLEGQVEELEVMNDEYQDREDQWNLLKLVIRCTFTHYRRQNYRSSR